MVYDPEKRKSVIYALCRGTRAYTISVYRGELKLYCKVVCSDSKAPKAAYAGALRYFPVMWLKQVLGSRYLHKLWQV